MRHISFKKGVEPSEANGFKVIAIVILNNVAVAKFSERPHQEMGHIGWLRVLRHTSYAICELLCSNYMAYGSTY